MTIDPAVLKFINHIAPEHGRSSCDDESLYNAVSVSEEENTVLCGRCARCSLLYLAKNPDVKLPVNEETECFDFMAFLS